MSQFGNQRISGNNPNKPANFSPPNEFKITPQLYGGTDAGFVGVSVNGTPNGSGPTFNVNVTNKGNYGATVGWKWTF